GIGRGPINTFHPPFFRPFNDPRHRLYRFDRVGTHARLPRQHHRVGAVEHGVRAVRCFRPGGSRAGDHRFQHLGGDDDGFGVLLAQFHGALLHEGNLFEGKFHPEVPAGDHDTVEGFDDLLEVVDRLGLFHLRDHGDVDVFFVHDLRDVLVITGRAYEGQRDVIRAHLQPPEQVVGVLLAQGGYVDGDAGEVEALVVRYGHGNDDFRLHVGVGDVEDLDRHPPVVDENDVAYGNILGEALERRRDAFLGSGNVVGGDGEDVPFSKLVLVFDEPTEPDLRAL